MPSPWSKTVSVWVCWGYHLVSTNGLGLPFQGNPTLLKVLQRQSRQTCWWNDCDRHKTLGADIISFTCGQTHLVFCTPIVTIVPLFSITIIVTIVNIVNIVIITITVFSFNQNPFGEGPLSPLSLETIPPPISSVQTTWTHSLNISN